MPLARKNKVNVASVAKRASLKTNLFSLEHNENLSLYRCGIADLSVVDRGGDIGDLQGLRLSLSPSYPMQDEELMKGIKKDS